MQGHERVGSTQNGLVTMITQTGTRPQFLHCNDVVITLGAGDSHYEMVDQLRRTVWRRFAEDQRTRVGGWLRSATGSN